MKYRILTLLLLLQVAYCKGQKASFSYSQPSKCVVSTVSFTNTSPAGYTAINWNWGDPYDPNPDYKGTDNPTSHPFTQPGKYVITLTLTYPSGTVTYKDSLIVYALPNFSFRKLNDSICPGGSVSFSPTLIYPAAAKGVKSYYWNFGDGLSDTVANPKHIYANSGNNIMRYNLSLTLTDTNGCVKQVDSLSYVYVKNKPIAQFTVNSILCYISGATTATASFTNQTTGAVSYLWDFGDGTTSTQPAPSHTYAYRSNPYTVKLIATNAEGCTDTAIQTIQPVAYTSNYTVSDTILCDIPHTKLMITGLDGATYYQWIWGDGTSDYFSSGEHVYTTQGDYRLLVEATHSFYGCKAYDTVTIHAYNRQNPVHDGRYYLHYRMDVDWTKCDTSIPFTFINTTSYAKYDDFGFGSVKWIFEDYTVVGGDTISRKFSTYGKHPFTAIITTPYGCVLDTVWRDSILKDESWIREGWTHVRDTFDYEVFNGDTTWYYCYDTLFWLIPKTVLLTDSVNIFRTRSYTIVKGKGCIPVTASVRNDAFNSTLGCCSPFIKSADPVVKAVIYWDFYGSPTDTTDFALPDPPDSIIWNAYEEHVYLDTGVFQVALVVTNIEGCVDTILLGKAMAGIPLTGTYTHEFKQQCYNEYQNPANWYYVKFIVNEDTTINPESYYIVDKFGDTSAVGDNPMVISPRDTGYWGVEIIPSWHGCWGTGEKKEGILYACPAIAHFEFENVDTNNRWLYLHSLTDTIVTWEDVYEPRFCNCPATMGFRDAGKGHQWQHWWFGDAALLAEQSTDTAKVTSFMYSCKDSFIYSTAGYPGGIIVNYAVYNADSVNIYSPTYNRCKYCADTTKRIFYISDAKMNFLADKYEICTGDSITFYDSSILNMDIFAYWNFWADSAINTNPAFLEYEIDSLILHEGYGDWGGIFGDTTLLFTLPNAYRFVLVNMDWLKCTRHDTLSVTINPQSVPHFISAADNRNFNSLRDTLCLNNPDTVFIKDSSYTASPFEQIKVTQWQWIAFEDTFDIKNPVIPAKIGGIQPIDLTITNEKGCVSSLRDTLVVQEAFAQWQTSRKRYCNGANVTFTNRSGIEPLLDYSGDGITCIWDWGDGTSEIQNISSGQFPSPIIDHRYNLPKGANDVVVITLRVRINGLDCENVYKDSLTIGTLNAGFTVDERYFPCPSSVGRTLTFSDTSRGTVTYYRWNFGDTASGSDNEAEGWNIHSPIHKYSKAGTYDVKLTVEDNIGCIDTLVKEAFIFIDGPSGDFSYLPLSGCVPLEVRFFPTVENTDTIIVNPNLSLEIVRGGIYVDSSISYTYEQIGAFLPYFYLIKWTTDSEGNPERCVWDWQGKDTIFVVDILPKFTVDSLYCIGVSVLFEDESTVLPGNLLPDSVHWDFGNGQTANTSAAATQYDSAGSYNTTMSVYVKNCVKTMSLPIEVMPFPELFFHPDTASACNNLEVLFFTDTLTEQENARITGYNWTFSDGEHYTSNPIRRTFTLTGWYLYDVLLSFIPENCVKLYNDSIYVNVFIVPTAEFEPKPPTVRMGETIHFVDKSQQGDGNIISWRWDIGEDTYSQEQSPKHVYKTLSGYVTVYLVIADTNGCTDSIEHQVLILENLRFPNIFTAQAFRPDGRPYVFRPLANEGYFKEFKIAIYNRFGMLVWKQSCKEPNCPDYDNDAFWWNGKSQFGEPVPDGVYYWVVYAIPLSETQTFILNGSVTIIR